MCRGGALKPFLFYLSAVDFLVDAAFVGELTSDVTYEKLQSEKGDGDTYICDCVGVVAYLSETPLAECVMECLCVPLVWLTHWHCNRVNRCLDLVT